MKVFAFLLFASFFSCALNSQSGNVYNMTDVDVIPKFEGGESGMKLFIDRNLKWPSSDFGYSGYVVVSAIVNESGILDSITIKKSLCPFCDEEAMRVVSLMPIWKPALKRDKIVSCKIEIPIHFGIKE